MIDRGPSLRLSTAAFFLGVIILLADIYLVYVNCQHLIISNQRIAGTGAGLMLVEDVKEMLLDVQERAEAYRPGRRRGESEPSADFARLHRHLDDLRALLRASHPKQERILSVHIDTLLQSLSAPPPATPGPSAPALLQNIHHLTMLLQGMEEQLIAELQQQQQAARSAQVALVVSLLVAAVTALVLLAGVLALARQEQQHHQRFLVTLASIGDGVIITDARGKISLLNPVAQFLTGWTSAAASGRSLDEVFRMQPNSAADGATPSMGDPAVQTLQGQLLSRSGRSIPVERSIAPLRNAEDERPRGTLLIFRDISQRLQAKAALQETAQQLRYAFDEAVVGMALVDRQARFLKANRRYCQMLGYSEEELLQMTVAQVTHPEDVAGDIDRIRQAMATNSSGYCIEKRFLTRNGKIVVGRCTVSIVRDRRGQPLYAFGMFEDQTQKRELENQLRQSQKMEAIGRLAGGVAHDFNNLLTAILGYCELLQQRAGDPQDKEDLEEIRKAGQRAADLTRHLLAFSRQNPIQSRVVNLNDVVQDIRRMLTRLIGDDVELSTELAPDLAPVRGDPTQLAQVIMNLAVNARDAMPQGGKLILRTGNVDPVGNPEVDDPGAPMVYLDVEDNGTGMTREVMTHLFEPFFTTKDSGRGSGLGLAVAYGIVNQAGGHFQVKSDLGRGTRFRIYLPRVDAVVSPPPVRSVGEASAGSGETILLVEDEAQIRQLFSLLLQQRGYRVLDAANAEQALALVRSQQAHIQLLITDVVLPHLSGPELARQLQQLQPQLRIIFISGYAPGNLVRPEELPPQALFLQKPFTAEVLASKVREALEQPFPAAKA